MLTGSDKEKVPNKKHLGSKKIFEASENIEGIPSNIIGITTSDDDPNKILVLVENEEGVSFLITREKAHKVCPQLLIGFYESRLEWQS